MCFCPVYKGINVCTGELTAHDDLLVIGSGPAGQRVAIEAAKLGNKVGIIERKEVIGGGCIHSGTMPSTLWREWVRSLTGLRQRGRYGANCRVKPDSTMEGLVFRANH